MSDTVEVTLENLEQRIENLEVGFIFAMAGVERSAIKNHEEFDMIMGSFLQNTSTLGSRLPAIISKKLREKEES